MFQKFIAARLITPPAIWGKLPAHADFVRSGMRHGESQGWQPWLARQAAQVGQGGALPAAFVLPPGELAFAPHCFVLGVITPSMDKTGRQHPLLVYQLARPRWVERYFEAQAVQSGADDWLFWLARAVARHMHAGTDVQGLERTVQTLWRLYAPGWSALWRRGAQGFEEPERAARRREQAPVLLHQMGGAASPQDPALQLRGVRYLPWVDWPQRLFKARPESAFWQQDATGGFVNATQALPALWGVME